MLQNKGEKKDKIQQPMYELLPEMTYKQKQWCYAMSFNHTRTLLALAANQDIKIFQFADGFMKQIQQLRAHSYLITTLNTLRSRQHLISSSEDTSIIIWSTNLLQNPKYLIKLKGHQSYINCLVVHPINENLIVSGSDDKTIKFWSNHISTQQLINHEDQKTWFCSQTINDHTSMVYGLSINQNGNKLLSCGNDNIILLLSSSNKQKWQVLQKIKVDKVGFRLSFITDNLFAFQVWARKFILIYSISQVGRCIKQKEIVIKGEGATCMQYFPLIYNSAKQILISKNRQNINILSLKFSAQSNSYSCDIEQNIDYGDFRIFGTMSDDGEFLITWDQNSQSIQVRKFRQKIGKKDG
ncbi:unnamed protein product [Paramecium pentaurelia]|uniref:Uncharacterized protein n=1 Tax=Paramecium pentaurelia TaxID=43138 RepID=A0A8S1UKB7_9CILI|nr:unnamed protein product [Paramecium pentaurelia]